MPREIHPPDRRRRGRRCTCAAYPWPHRPRGGFCRWPDPPTEKWEGQSGRHPGTFGRVTGGSSALRRRVLRQYALHPIRDRAYIRRWLPKLYAAVSRRQGWHWVCLALGGWVPAMRMTEHGAPPDVTPYTRANLLSIILQGTSRRGCWSTPPIKRRLRQRSERAPVGNGDRPRDGGNERAPCRSGVPASVAENSGSAAARIQTRRRS